MMIFIFKTAAVFGQGLSSSPYGMPADQNSLWLKKVINSAKDQQLTLIQDRFFRQKEYKKTENDDVPIIVMNGLVVNELSNQKLKNFLSYQLTADKVGMVIMEKEPEQLYVNKRWTGIVILTIDDKKTIRKLLRE